jgi:hypothetical protein
MPTNQEHKLPISQPPNLSKPPFHSRTAFNACFSCTAPVAMTRVSGSAPFQRPGTEFVTIQCISFKTMINSYSCQKRSPWGRPRGLPNWLALAEGGREMRIYSAFRRGRTCPLGLAPRRGEPPLIGYQNSPLSKQNNLQSFFKFCFRIDRRNSSGVHSQGNQKIT